ncbi:MAG TPA: sigma-70 family RNA polymerase sigma factor [Kofleriaceae bacterium]
MSDHDQDLALAAAALGGDAAAQRAIDRMIRIEAERAVSALRQPAWLTDEVHQELAQRLLVGGEPRLATYAGQSALGRWLGVAATRTALNLMRERRPQVALDEDDEAIAAAIADPDVALMRERYRDEVAGAVRAAFEALDNARDRNLLRLYYLERVGVVELGQMYQVHASTVSRWLAALREHIVADTQFRLAERLGISGHYDDLASVIRALRSDLDVTLSRLLR